MKKLIAGLLALSLLMCFSTGIANENWGTTSLNEAQIAGYSIALLLGDPFVINTPKEDSFDEINGRYIYIGYEELGCDLGIALRISDSQMYFWSLELTPENLTNAKLLLDENAPFCSFTYYENNKIKDIAIYTKSLNSIYSYDDFTSKVDKMIASLSSGDMSAAKPTDPILACFPGLSWGMSREEMKTTIGNDIFTEIKSEAGTSLFASPTIFGETISVIFVFGSNNKVNMFSAMMSKEKINQYLDALTQAYGTPHKTTFMGALNGRMMPIQDDPNGDYYAWKTDKSLIILDSSSVQYWSLY